MLKNISNSKAEQFLAFDFGTKTIGCASGNIIFGKASPIGSFLRKDYLQNIKNLVQEWQPDALIIGIPYFKDGKNNENTLKAKNFAEVLRKDFQLKVFEVDERFSTVEAISNLEFSSSKDIDALSACVILEQFLQNLEKLKNESKKSENSN